MDEVNSNATVETVLGPVDAASLGATLVHEHLWSDMTSMLGAYGDAEGTAMDSCAVAGEARWNSSVSPDNYRLTDLALQIEEISDAVACGVRTFVDATPPALGRDPNQLVELSRATGAHVVMGCGWYLERTHGDDVRRLDVDGLATALIGEIRHGVGETGIRPGVIGEIGTGDPLTEPERRCLRAAAVAATETGLALSVHVHPWGTEGHEVIDTATGEGLAHERILLNHLTTAVDRPEYLTELLERGVNLAFDLFGFDHSLLAPGRYPPSDYDTVLRLVDLVEAGHADRLFVSQDVGVRTRLLRYGGWGYGHLLRHVVPLMSQQGLGPEVVDRLLVTNPARLLAATYEFSDRSGYGSGAAESIPPTGTPPIPPTGTPQGTT